MTLKILCFYNFCDKHPVMGKNAAKVWNNNSPYISPHLRCEIFDEIQFVPFILLLGSEIKKEKRIMWILTPINLCKYNEGQVWNFHLKYLDVEKKREKFRNPLCQRELPLTVGQSALDIKHYTTLDKFFFWRGGVYYTADKLLGQCNMLWG